MRQHVFGGMKKKGKNILAAVLKAWEKSSGFLSWIYGNFYMVEPKCMKIIWKQSELI